MSKQKNNQPPPEEKERKPMLRVLRENAGLTREQMVARLGNRISISTLIRWENTPMEPSMSRRDWYDFCNAVGVAFDELPLELAKPTDIVVDRN